MEFIFVLTGFFLLIASLSDLKSREVPDWLSFSLISVGLGSSILYALIFAEWRPLAYSVLGFAACWIIGLLMFYSGQWGGGDAKLIMGLGSVLGLSWHGFPVLVTFLVLTMVAGAVYGIAYGFFLMAKHWTVFKEGLKKFMASPKVVLSRRFVLIFALFLAVSALWLPLVMRFLMWCFVVLALIGYYLVLLMKVLEKTCLIKELPVSKLTEGDWIFKEVKVKGNRICGPKDLGISLSQIAQLKKLKVKKVWVKEGIPFVPSFFLAYLLTLWKSAWFLSWFF